MRLMFSCIVLCLAASLLSAEEPLIAHVSSQVELLPLYVIPIKADGSGFDKTYIASLEKIIRFDFAHDGRTEIVSTAKGMTKIEAAIVEKKLQVKVSRPMQGGDHGIAKGIEDIVLSGDIAQDRQILHQVHDTLFQALFGAPGVANTRILYTLRTRSSQDASRWVNDVWQADYDGANAKRVTHDGCLCVTPTFVPTQEKGRCRHFLFVSYKIGQPKIFASNIGDGKTKRVTFLRGNQLMPTVSPTSDRIAFINDITGNPDLFIQDFNLEQGLIGKPRQIFCAPGGAQGTPTFSPNGKKIAFVSNKDGTPRIYMIEIPATGASIKNIKARIVSKKTKENTCPAWSPDGKKIAYSALTQGIRQIWIYDVTTEEEMQLTAGSGHKENPTWAPNSLHIIYNSTTGSASDLYLINLNQKEATQITQGEGEKRFPAWEPRKI